MNNILKLFGLDHNLNTGSNAKGFERFGHLPWRPFRMHGFASDERFGRTSIESLHRKFSCNAGGESRNSPGPDRMSNSISLRTLELHDGAHRQRFGD